MNDEQIREIIKDEIAAYFKSNKVLFHRNFQIMDNVNIQTGRSNGTTIGTANDQKIGVYGKKVVQAGVIADPTGGITNDGQARAAINSILTALRNFGIIAT